MRTLIKNALIIDGTGTPGIKGSVLFEDGIIKGVGNIDISDADKVIDAKGMVVAPGFIDTHSHSDLAVFSDPSLPAKLLQGVTTEVLGQDGISLSPLPEEYISPWRKNLAGLDGENDNFNWHFKDTKTYLDMIEKNGSGTNLCYLVPHGNVRMEARGLGSGYATDSELKNMTEILEREILSGGVGYSTGLIYMPCAYADTKEMVETCKISAKYDLPFVIHQRSEADTIIDSMKEVIAIGRDSGVWVHFSHFKLCGKYNAPFFEGMVELLDQAPKEGIRVSFDQYPYAAGSTMLGVILPPWAHDGGTDALITRLDNQSDRKRMTEDIHKGIHGWDNFVAFAGLEGIFVTDAKLPQNQELIGKSLEEIGKIRGKDPLEATYDLLRDEKNAVGMVDFYGLEEHVRALITRPEMNACTDGLLGGKPHPRAYGAFPRILGKYVREEKLLSLHEAVRKMTGKPAEVFHIKDRGLIREGYKADLVIFNPDTIIDKGTYTDPCQHPDGILDVFVNGTHSVKDGKLVSGVRGGKTLRFQNGKVE